MAQRVILHVGAPKTGTSYLESILWEHRERLLEDGIFLPGRSRRAHDALMGDVRGGIWRHERPTWTWDRLAEVARGRHDTVLVSKEMLSGASAEQAEQAVARLAPQEVHVVVTVRELSGSMPSAWQQAVKARSTIPFRDWVAAVRADPGHGFWRHHDPLSILARWAPGFPADRVHVVTMPAPGSEPVELWRRFARVLGVHADRYTPPPRPRNESLGALEVELLRRTNLALGDALPMRVPYLRAVHKSLTGPILMGTPGRRKFGVAAEHRDWLEHRAQQTIEELRAHPCELVGDLDDLLPAVAPDRPGPDEVTDADLAERAVAALADLLVSRAEDPASPRSA
ncbi:MAG: hypothetical protein ACXVW8_07800 [Nocardioidaceae bacterium]